MVERNTNASVSKIDSCCCCIAGLSIIITERWVMSLIRHMATESCFSLKWTTLTTRGGAHRHSMRRSFTFPIAIHPKVMAGPITGSSGSRIRTDISSLSPVRMVKLKSRIDLCNVVPLWMGENAGHHPDSRSNLHNAYCLIEFLNISTSYVRGQ